MNTVLEHFLSRCGISLAVASLSYLILAWMALRARLGARGRESIRLPPTTILKPLCGADPALYASLRSFCELRAPRLQILCGVREPGDPALAVVRRLQSEFPSLDLQIVIKRARHGSSAKVSNLMNMLPHARHDFLVIADADVRVPSDYLQEVVTPLVDPNVGIVTCLYRGSPISGVWSRLGAQFINEWFMPSVRVAALFGSRAFAFGATIALRRETLWAIGGFARIADQLADDYRLGELTRELGLRTVLCAREVETLVHEPTLPALLQHQLRWLRTIRSVQPVGYAASFVTLGWPVAVLGALLAGMSTLSVWLIAAAFVARLMLVSQGRRSRSWYSQLCLVVVADTLMLLLWVWSFVTDRVRWRQSWFRVARDGSMRPLVE